MSWPCRRCISARTRALARHVAGPIRSRYKICIATLAPVVRALPVVSRALPRVSQPPTQYCGALLRRIATLALCIASHDTIFFVSRPKGRLNHDTNFVSQHPHLARLRVVSQASSAHVARTVGHIVVVLGRVATPSWRAQACVPA